MDIPDTIADLNIPATAEFSNPALFKIMPLAFMVIVDARFTPNEWEVVISEQLDDERLVVRYIGNNQVVILVNDGTIREEQAMELRKFLESQYFAG